MKGVRRIVPQLVVLVGASLVAAGIGFAVAWQWGIAAGGVELIAYGLLFIDDGQPAPRKRIVAPPVRQRTR